MAGSMFWASLAGARADENDELATNNQTLRNNYLAWKQHAQDQEARADHLEQQVGRLQAVLGQWQDEAATADANAGVALKAFKEVTGKSVREHLGDEETDRRLAEEKSDSRRNYGLK